MTTLFLLCAGIGGTILVCQAVLTLVGLSGDALHLDVPHDVGHDMGGDVGHDVVQEITHLKEADGPELQVHGSSNLIQTLLKHNLIDEMHVLIFPVVIGNGKRLFGEGTTPSGFKLVDSRTSPSGVIIARYTRSGELKTGTFA